MAEKCFLIILAFALPGALSTASPSRVENSVRYVDSRYTISYRELPRHQEIEFSGEILPTTSRTGLRMVRDRLVRGKNTVLVLRSSLGGHESAFRNFGKLLRAGCDGAPQGACKLTTVSMSACASACIELFMYGQVRVVSPSSLFGFHRKWVLTPGLPIISSVGMVKKFVALGADEKWLNANLHIFNDQYDGTWLNAQQLFKAKFATRYDGKMPAF